MKITKAVRSKQPALISLWGNSSSGKTYSALRLARGMVGTEGKIGVIDTENRRSLFYSGSAGGEWHHLNLDPPFTPERYIEAFNLFEHAGGFDCIIIDSASHVWEGEGGVMDIAAKSGKKGLAQWGDPKKRLKRMVNTFLRSHCHVIFCMRAKMGKMQEGSGAQFNIISTGLEPIMEKGLIYEMFMSVCLGPDQKPVHDSHPARGFINPGIPAIKIPGELLHALPPGEHISEQTGDILRSWLAGTSHDVVEDAKRAANRGTASFRSWWRSLTKEKRDSLASHVADLKSLAGKADHNLANETASIESVNGAKLDGSTTALAEGFEDEASVQRESQSNQLPLTEAFDPPSKRELFDIAKDNGMLATAGADVQENRIVSTESGTYPDSDSNLLTRIGPKSSDSAWEAADNTHDESNPF